MPVLGEDSIQLNSKSQVCVGIDRLHVRSKRLFSQLKVKESGTCHIFIHIWYSVVSFSCVNIKGLFPSATILMKTFFHLVIFFLTSYPYLSFLSFPYINLKDHKILPLRPGLHFLGNNSEKSLVVASQRSLEPKRNFAWVCSSRLVPRARVWMEERGLTGNENYGYV